jgi:hypothetical protein
MQLHEKYMKRNFDVSSEGPSSGVLFGHFEFSLNNTIIKKLCEISLHKHFERNLK